MNLLLGFIAGIVIGLVHFTALGWSIRIVVLQRRSTLWMIGVGCVRLTASVAMLAFVVGYGVAASLSALVGMWFVRSVMIFAPCGVRHAHA